MRSCAVNVLVSSDTLVRLHARLLGLFLRFGGAQRISSAMILVAATGLLVVGCYSSDRERVPIDGYWKGQMVEGTITGPASTTGRSANRQPWRILLKIEESEGIVQGRFANSSDAIAFRQIDDESSRRITTYAVTGTLEGSSFRIRFSLQSGRTYEVDAVVDKRVIAGRYLERYMVEGVEESTSGKIRIERF